LGLGNSGLGNSGLGNSGLGNSGLGTPPITAPVTVTTPSSAGTLATERKPAKTATEEFKFSNI